ncbi:calcium/calmodulin-regulated receptor-like kinase 2 [Zingiber officinale]|uniref:calcium/calmodulin-regulated receptor-like kinase 2 n=1 Tax=Zingiber officinale TaxID=94328 RepID=UPI001C4B2259|nr:calcium/calmodulin-regulated receptor-like kinase 2 [Zingiber officinale]XP_042406037.1 calcium/calmodulin-regulated receptor-like kinase 2 [Zingiber officinale]XP_042406038.1 calcium/calmodulin-regulated receptor-like kinase 2 [Zingiber officinale]XP_042406039.1 calcium/calmodulin-regulated receptor-like kinase 2 [Zingiber officinale]
MRNQTLKIAIGVSVGVVVGILIGCGVLIFMRLYRKRSWGRLHPKNVISTTLPIHANGVHTSIDSSASISVSHVDSDKLYVEKRNAHWNPQQNKDLFTSLSAIPRYSYKDIKTATQNFTTVLGQGSFGPVYKAAMPTGELVAVKMLASDSTQGEKEFQTEVLLLSRLHHRNLVNLVGFCIDNSQRMLVYEFMTNGNLATLLYNDGPRILSWEERVQIAYDVSHGIEYLHEGAAPPIIHRDLKSANILLDMSMRAKISDFGLSKEETFDGRKSGLKGTYGYMDPDYMSTNKFTKKSDIYSFGIILFELITAINPQQGLMDYINLAVIGEDSKADWEEIADKRLVGTSHPEEVKLLADIAYKCLHKIPRKRPSIADISRTIARIKHRPIKNDELPTAGRDVPRRVIRRIENLQVELLNMTSLKGHQPVKV